MNVKHTAGPWECTNHIDEEHFADIESINGPLYIRAQWASHYGRLTKDQHKLRDAEMMANARLIASAPDLLEALRRCRFDSLNMTLEDLDFCKAAFAKATGEPA